MNKWKHTLNLSNYWYTQEWTNENVHELGKIIAGKLKIMFKGWENGDDLDLYDIIDHMDDICTQEQVDEINQENEAYGYDLFPDPLDEFDEWMGALYDWCDENNVWVKLD